MTLDSFTEYEKSKGTPFTEAEQDLLNKMFGNSNRIDGVIATSKSNILNAVKSDKNCYIIHEDGRVDKTPPKDNEIYFGVYFCKICETSFLLARPV